MEILKRADFTRHVANNQLQLTNNTVKAYPVQTGALCEVYVRGNSTNLVNGKTHFANDELSKYLVDIGITGKILIHHTSLNRGVPKWLTYNQHHTDFNDWKKNIKIYTFDQLPEKVGDIPIESIRPLAVRIDDIGKEIDRLSYDVKFDGMLIEASTLTEDNMYHLMPTRYCEGIIKSVNSADGYRKLVVTISHNGMEYLTPISKLTNTMNELIDAHKDKLVERRLKIQYVSFVPGDRLENFSSPTALFVINMNGV